MSQYAKNTNVSCELSRLEIEKTLVRYGADNFAYATSNGQALIGFTMYDRQIKFVLALPKKEEFRYTPTGRDRSENSQYEAWEQACRQRWRALNLVIKAKLEAVECGISVTVGDFMKPQIEQAYISGAVPKMLPMLEEAE